MIDQCKLSISDLRIWIHLGVSEQEKFYPQCVRFDIDLIFTAPPKGTVSDKLEDTISYSHIVRKVHSYCEKKQFNLIEYLAFEVCKVIDQSLDDKRSNIALIKVTVCKIAPPVEGMHGGVSFSYCRAPSIKTTQSVART